jgi:hypothetical protein
MFWIIAAIFAYFLFAITALIDRYLVRGPIPGARVYAFYVGISSIFVLFLIPFTDFLIPAAKEISVSFLAGAIFLFALFSAFWALRRFEASRIIPAVGGILPLFTLGLTYLFFEQQISWNLLELFSFGLLISGSILITYKPPSPHIQKAKLTIPKSFQISVIIALLFALYFFLSKMVYLEQPFWRGFIWIRLGIFFTALFFLLSKEVRKEIFKKQISFKKETAKLFISNQCLAAGGSILQSWAIALAPLGFLAFINALEGTRYIFLLILTILVSLKFPWAIKEDISKKALRQKFAAIFLISLGLIIFAL